MGFVTAQNRSPLNCDQIQPGFCGPYFSIVGAMKCGTNAIAEFISKHPYIKHQNFENFFFSGTGGFPKFHEPTFDDTSIDPLPGALQRYAKVIGVNTDWNTSFTYDKSPGYLPHLLAPKRMAKALPHVKIIAIVCDPVEKFRSMYYHYLRINKMERARGRAFYQEREMIDALPYDLFVRWCLRVKNDNEEATGCAFLPGGFYEPGLSRWLEAVGRERIYVVDSHKLKTDPQAVMKDVLSFLGLREELYPCVHEEAVYQNAMKEEAKTLNDTDTTILLRTAYKNTYRYLRQEWGIDWVSAQSPRNNNQKDKLISCRSNL